MEYFSDIEKGPRARTVEVLSPPAWGGIVGAVQSLIVSGAFGKCFPELCPDGSVTVGTDQKAFALALRGEIPELEWPLVTDRIGEDYTGRPVPWAPDTLVGIDFVQFCYRRVAKPMQGAYHDYFRHHHLSFDTNAGKDEFLSDINRIFARNGLAYELQADGSVVRLGPPVLAETLRSSVFASGDAILDGMLEDSRRKFLNPDAKVRREAVERLWDSWERLKSLQDPSDKKRSVSQLLDKATAEPGFRGVLEADARALTEIGNTFHIRHSEADQTLIVDSRHLDYLFHRLFSLILLLLNERQWGQVTTINN